MPTTQSEDKSQRIWEILYSVVELDPDMSEARLVLNFRSAQALYALFQNNYLFDPLAFSKFLPSLSNLVGDKLQLELDDICKKNEMLCVHVKNEKFYPNAIIDPSTTKIYSALPPVIKQARKEGYDDWEILDCLVTEAEIPTGEIYVGKPINHTSVDDSLGKLDETEDYPDEYMSVIPLECLKKGDTELFNRFVDDWLEPLE